MKTLRAIISLAVAALCTGATIVVRGPVVAPSSGAPTYTLLYDSVTAQTGGWPVGDVGNHTYAGVLQFTDSVSRTIGKVSVKLDKSAGSITGKTFRVKIWSMTGDALNAVLATSDAVTGSDAWSATLVDFVFSTPYTTTGSTNYGITIDMGGSDGSNYASGYNTTPSLIPGHLGFWNAAGSQINDFSDYDFQVKIYTTP